MMISFALPAPGMPAASSRQGRAALTTCLLIALIDGHDTLMPAFIAAPITALSALAAAIAMWLVYRGSRRT